MKPKYILTMIITLGLALCASVGYSSDVEKAQVETVMDQSPDFDVVSAIELADDAVLVDAIVVPDGEYITIDVTTILKANKSRYRWESFIPPESTRDISYIIMIEKPGN